MSKPLLSVVIPIYNEKNTCEKLINRVKKVSISKQIVVVDDGSTDGSKEILMKIEGIDTAVNKGTIHFDAYQSACMTPDRRKASYHINQALQCAILSDGPGSPRVIQYENLISKV